MVYEANTQYGNYASLYIGSILKKRHNTIGTNDITKV